MKIFQSINSINIESQFFMKVRHNIILLPIQINPVIFHFRHYIKLNIYRNNKEFANLET